MGKIVGLTFENASGFACPHCGKAYKTADALAKHIKDKHPDTAGNGPAESAGGSQEH